MTLTTQNAKHRRGDRADGYLIRKLDPLFLLIPHVMKTRMDAQVFIDEQLPITQTERFVREHKADIPGLSLLHVVLAALVRIVSQRPQLNRFVIGGRVYARKYLRISMIVKEEMSDEGAEANIMPVFPLDSTLQDVVRLFNQAYTEAMNEAEGGNDTDKAARFFGALPNGLRRFAVNCIRALDNKGWAPKFVGEVSPFHSSFYVTSVGSLGVNPVFHHLYDFGTVSAFIAIGKKGGTREDRTLGVRFTLDERICDGFYFSNSIKKFRSILKNPEQLLEPPEKIVYDELQ